MEGNYKIGFLGKTKACAVGSICSYRLTFFSCKGYDEKPQTRVPK